MRKAKVQRKTKETEITAEINLDSNAPYNINTSIPFMDHMLTLMCHHGNIAMKIKAKGDTDVDYHHLMEDIGITMGEALQKSIGEKRGIRRYGFSKVPMDESLAEVVIDLSGRPYLVYNVSRKRGKLNDLPVSLFEDFFRAFTIHSTANIHITLHYGRDLHHIYEAVFKAFGRALRDAVTVESRRIPSTKGTL